jgi:hypothetical protein
MTVAMEAPEYVHLRPGDAPPHLGNAAPDFAERHGLDQRDVHTLRVAQAIIVGISLSLSPASATADPVVY